MSFVIGQEGAFLIWSLLSKAPFTFLRGVYTGSDPELFAFTRDRIHLEFMNSQQHSSKPYLLFQIL